MRIVGIYQIKNRINGHLYIGQSSNMRVRWMKHIDYLKKNKHWNKHLQSAWNLYTEINFTFEVLELCDISELTIKEQHHFDRLAQETVTYNKGLFTDNPFRGRKHSNETINKLRRLNTGANNKRYGIVMSDETKQKIRLSKLGKKHSDEQKRHRSIRLMGANNPNFGKKHSPETRKKIADANKKYAIRNILIRDKLGRLTGRSISLTIDET